MTEDWNDDEEEQGYDDYDSDSDSDSELSDGFQEERTIDGYTPEQESQLRGFAKRFHGDVSGMVRGYMEQFFKDKMFHCGGRIPKSLLFTEHRISLVLNYDIVRGVERAYESLSGTVTAAEKELVKLNGDVTSDIKLVNETLNLLARSCIPQQFAGGMMLLYLEFVEGVDIGIGS